MTASPSNVCACLCVCFVCAARIDVAWLRCRSERVSMCVRQFDCRRLCAHTQLHHYRCKEHAPQRVISSKCVYTCFGSRVRREMEYSTLKDCIYLLFDLGVSRCRRSGCCRLLLSSKHSFNRISSIANLGCLCNCETTMSTRGKQTDTTQTHR